MPLRVTNLELPVEESEQQLRDLILARLNLGKSESISWRILRKSLDARSRDCLRFVYTVVVTWQGESEWQKSNPNTDHVQCFVPAAFDEPPTGSLPLNERPIIVGSGPGGLLAAYYLA